MKKLFCIFCILLLSGCLNKEVKDVFVTPITPEEETKFLYTPGTYYGQSVGYHGVIEVEVTVSESEIITIEILNHSEQNYLNRPVTDPTDPTDEDTTEVPDDAADAEEVEVLGAIDEIVNKMIYGERDGA